ncbi:MAG TPA: glycoside hydrolase family 66 protein [Acidimicrobiales bacterium]|nr:glycoside hydrolase family 66 protein [Acidimicrobiales bacterium]
MPKSVGNSFTRGDTEHRLTGLRSFYESGKDVVVLDLPIGTTNVVAEAASGRSVAARMDEGALFDGLDPGTYAVQASDATGQLLAEEFTTVGAHPGERPVHGFATSFSEDDVAEVMAWNRALRSTVVQVYDWMDTYTEPLGPVSGWEDPSHRPVSLSALRSLANGLASEGAVAHAYAPIYAVGNAFADAHPEMLLYQDDGSPIRFLDQITLANPANTQWQQHFVAAYGAAADAIGFTGFHVDTYGYPRIAFDASGASVDMRAAYADFLVALRAGRPGDLVSFNQVDGVPSAAYMAAAPAFRYCEVWPPNDQWRHFEGLLDRSAGITGRLGVSSRTGGVVRGSIACYPPVWGIDSPSGLMPESSRPDALRTALLTEAIVTQLSASALIFGDRHAALCDPYYPKHARLDQQETGTVLDWRRFALRCRDLFIEGEDTSWYEIGDENGSVSVEADAQVRPEPVGGALFARVVHTESSVVIGVVDLTGSENGSWSERTAPGRVKSTMVTVLLDRPDAWQADAAILGQGGGRFTKIASRNVAHRQGRALQVEMPLSGGWSVLRVSRKGSSHES